MKIIVFFVCIFFHVKGAIGFQLQGKDFASRLAEIKGYESAGVGTVERGVIFSFFQFVFQKTGRILPGSFAQTDFQDRIRCFDRRS